MNVQGAAHCAPCACESGEDEVLAHRLDHLPGAFHSWLDHEHVTCLEVLRFLAFRGDDAVAIEEG